MSDDSIALSSNDTETLSCDLDNLQTDIEKSLFDMSTLITNLSSVLDGDVSNSSVEKFSEFEDEFPVIGSNLKSYVKDFKNLVTNFNEQNNRVQTNNVTEGSEGGELINVRV